MAGGRFYNASISIQYRRVFKTVLSPLIAGLLIFIGVDVTRKVLDVGQCNADNYRISELLNQHFDVQLHRSHSLTHAIEATSKTTYDLILINRLLDADGSAGMDVLASLKLNPSSADTPVMIVSNFQDAQDLAIQNGAVAGFGKAELDSAETLAKLKQYLE